MPKQMTECFDDSVTFRSGVYFLCWLRAHVFVR